MVHEVKGIVNEETDTVQMEFAENIVSIHDEEIQSAYVNKNSVTLHPVEVHYKRNVQDEENDEDLGCLFKL